MAKKKTKKNAKQTAAKPWKVFELRVMRTERAFAPHGAVVKPNDWIRNLITGKKRQVDASIRCLAGTATLLTTIECRKRKKVQDDTWIEQLATKRQHLGAA